MGLAGYIAFARFHIRPAQVAEACLYLLILHVMAYTTIRYLLTRREKREKSWPQRIEDFRFMALTATVGNPDSWSEVVLIGFAGFLLLYAFYLQRVNRQMTLSTAELVTSYHNQLAVCEDQLADVSAKYLKLKTELDEEMEASPTARSAQLRSQAAAVSGNDSSSDHAPGPAGPNTSSSVEQQLGDEVAKLKEQISRDGATVISLRQQNVTLSRRVEEEQQKTAGCEASSLPKLRKETNANDRGKRPQTHRIPTGGTNDPGS